MTMIQTLSSWSIEDAPGETAVEILIIRARRTPGRFALEDVRAPGAPPRSWTYAALRDDSVTLALALLSRFEPGERIAIWAPNSADWIVLQFAAAIAGLTLVTVEPSCGAVRLDAVLSASGAAGLFLGAFRDNNGARAFAGPRPATLREVVDLEERRALFAKRRCVEGLPEVGPDDKALMTYAPDGAGRLVSATVSHGDLAREARAAVARAGGPDAAATVRLPVGLPLARCGSLVVGAVQLGCRLVVERRSAGL